MEATWEVESDEIHGFSEVGRGGEMDGAFVGPRWDDVGRVDSGAEVTAQRAGALLVGWVWLGDDQSLWNDDLDFARELTAF
jgi:hypothetical protein